MKWYLNVHTPIHLPASPCAVPAHAVISRGKDNHEVDIILFVLLIASGIDSFHRLGAYNSFRRVMREASRLANFARHFAPPRASNRAINNNSLNNSRRFLRVLQQTSQPVRHASITNRRESRRTTRTRHNLPPAKHRSNHRPWSTRSGLHQRTRLCTTQRGSLRIQCRQRRECFRPIKLQSVTTRPHLIQQRTHHSFTNLRRLNTRRARTSRQPLQLNEKTNLGTIKRLHNTANRFTLQLTRGGIKPPHNQLN